MKDADEQVCVRERETGIAACQHTTFPLNPCQNIASSTARHTQVELQKLHDLILLGSVKFLIKGQQICTAENQRARTELETVTGKHSNPI